MLNKPDLLGVLSLMGKARGDLVSRTAHESPDLFRNLFEFENNFDMLNLAFEREFNLWIDKHFEMFDKYFNDSDSLHINDTFKKLMVELVESRVIRTSTTNDLASKDFCISLLSEKVSILNKFIEVSQNSEKQYQRLLYSYQRDKTLFDREFKKLMEE